MTRLLRRAAAVPALLAAFATAACLDTSPSAPEAVDDSAFHDTTPSASVASAAGVAAGGLEWAYLPEHVVLFSRGVPDRFQARVEALGGTVLRTHPEIGVAIVTGLADEEAEVLSREGGITGITRDVALFGLPRPAESGGSVLSPSTLQPASLPADAFFFPFQWNLGVIQADRAFASGFTDASGIRVAILDSGIDPFHVDLQGRVDASRSVAFVPSLNPAGPVWGDDDFHGTHVAGTVTTNNLGTAGVAPGASLIAVKVCGYTGGVAPGPVGCPLGAVISGLVHAGQVGAHVANLSLGGLVNIPAPGAGVLNGAMSRAVTYAGQQGTLVVAASGNAALDLGHLSRDFGVNAVRMVPCEIATTLCVSSTGPTDLLASYSNFGRSAINVAAPGGDLVVTFAPFTSMILAPCSSLTLDPDLAGCAGSPVQFVFSQGTSMAAPHVAGAAALAAAYSGRTPTPGQLRTGLERTADDLGPLGRDPFYGAGRINVCSLVGC
jgi:lantibiotic leader peptide-processing serine protease